MLKKIAVTGGLACGKSSVCRFFQDLGAYVVSADDIVHQLLSKQTLVGRQVIELLGDDIIVNGQIDRAIIAKKVFSNPLLLRSLEKIVHPSVLDEIEKSYQQVKIQGKTQLFIAEIPLLFEIGAESFFDAVITVAADLQSCIKRFTAVTGLSAIEYNERMALQLPTEEKARKADYIIENIGSIKDMQNEVTKLYHKLTR